MSFGFCMCQSRSRTQYLGVNSYRLSNQLSYIYHKNKHIRTTMFSCLSLGITFFKKLFSIVLGFDFAARYREVALAGCFSCCLGPRLYGLSESGYREKDIRRRICGWLTRRQWGGRCFSRSHNQLFPTSKGRARGRRRGRAGTPLPLLFKDFSSYSASQRREPFFRTEVLPDRSS